MTSEVVRLDPVCKQRLREFAADEGKPMKQVLQVAFEEHRRRRILEKTNEAYAALQADPAAWQAECDERAILDAAVSDGLEDV